MLLLLHHLLLVPDDVGQEGYIGRPRSRFHGRRRWRRRGRQGRLFGWTAEFRSLVGAVRALGYPIADVVNRYAVVVRATLELVPATPWANCKYFFFF